MQQEKQTVVRLAKRFRLHSAVAFQQPEAQLQGHEHCAGQAVAQHFQVGLPSQHPPGMPGVGNDVWYGDVVIMDGVENDDELVMEVSDGVKTEVTGRKQP